MNEENEFQNNNGEKQPKSASHTIVILLCVVVILILIYRIVGMILAFQACNRLIDEGGIKEELKEAINDVKDESSNSIASRAVFSGFATRLGAMKDEMMQREISVRGNEIIKGHDVKDAQVFNYLARSKDFYEVVNQDEESNVKWLSSGDAEKIPCTQINAELAKKINFSDIDFTEPNENGVKIPVSFFVTPKGNVFCFPPHEFDKKSYVTNDTTVKDLEGNELTGKEALTKSIVAITFSNGEVVKISNEPNVRPPVFMPGKELDSEIGVWHYAPDRVEGIDFSEYR